jgi:hypothetical protein
VPTGVWIRGTRVSDDEASALASRLRRYEDPIGIGVAERLERGVLMGTAMIGTSVPEAKIVLNVIEQWTPERLGAVAASLREFLGE